MAKFERFRLENINWEPLKKKTLKIVQWFASYTEWFLFVFLMMYKFYLFARYTDTVFYETGAKGFLENIYLFLFKGKSFNYLQHELVLVSLGFLLLFTFWVLFLKRKARIISLIVLNFFITFLIYADLIHKRYFGGFTSMSELFQINQVGDVAGSIMELIEGKDIFFWVDIIILIPIIIWVLKKIDLKPYKRKILGGFMALFIGWFSMSQSMFTFYYDYGGKDVLEKMVSDETAYSYTGILGYHFFDAKRFIKDYTLSKKGVPQERDKEITDYFEAKEDKINTDTFGLMKGKNLIIVQIEALQDFVIGREVNGEEITPNLNRLKEESVYFENFFHQTGQGRTSDADLLVNTSLYPLQSGSAFTRFPVNTYQTIVNSLQEKGYSSSVHHAFNPSFWNRNEIYRNWGYEKFYSINDFEGEQIGWGVNDKDFLIQSIDQMPEKPFYSFLITLTSHHPYPMPEEYYTLNVDGIQDKVLRDYLTATHYTDQAIGLFVEKLKEEGLWENSVVVFYGDHDAGILTQGQETGLFATEGSTNSVDYLLEADNIPLLIHFPNEELTGTYDKFGGQIDLAPTMLHLLGVDTSKKYFLGEDLFYDGERHPVVFSNQHMTDGKVWYVPSEGAFASGSCYDLETKEMISVNACRDMYNQAITEQEVSEDMILGNWLKDKE
ncbi:LTA synthase family protein [Ornithinibacillus scapharcae]|uniref:LTA synthase family protein n=1 Tax=Ornithinibacillus scapharcae TaxID=1147159 RepID=UPI000225B9C8|nr:LTA synthase family protein [Ornithinibacillus scapharcae]